MNTKWHKTWQDPQGATLIDEKDWFNFMQPLLLEMANTDAGRDLLMIPKEYGPIIRLNPNEITHGAPCGNGKVEATSRFYSTSKVANCIRTRWSEFKKYAKTFYEKEWNGRIILMPLLVLNGQRVAANVTTTFYPAPGSAGPTSDVDWYNNTLLPFVAGRVVASLVVAPNSAATDVRALRDASNTDSEFRRYVATFDTSAITVAATVTSANFGFNVALTSVNANDPTFHVVTFAPAANFGWVNTDANIVNFGTTNLSSSTPTVSTWSAALGTYVVLPLNVTGLGLVSKTGISKYGFISEADFTGVTPATSVPLGASNGGHFFYTADQAGSGQDPYLEVTYTIGGNLFPNLFSF